MWCGRQCQLQSTCGWKRNDICNVIKGREAGAWRSSSRCSSLAGLKNKTAQQGSALARPRPAPPPYTPPRQRLPAVEITTLFSFSSCCHFVALCNCLMTLRGRFCPSMSAVHLHNKPVADGCFERPPLYCCRSLRKRFKDAGKSTAPLPFPSLMITLYCRFAENTRSSSHQ